MLFYFKKVVSYGGDNTINVEKEEEADFVVDQLNINTTKYK